MMKFIILNGSPKGEKSVTLQYVNYLRKIFSTHEFKVINIAQKINSIEKNRDVFNQIIEEIKSCDGVLWAFPLYVFLVSSQYKRFIEMIFEREAQEAFKNKYTAVLSTSIHFYDHIAINYMNAICDDLNMKFIDYYSAYMYDLLIDDKRNKLECFFQIFIDYIEKKIDTIKTYKPIMQHEIEYNPRLEEKRIDAGDKRIIIVTDLKEENNLKKMIEKFSYTINGKFELVNLNTLLIKGGCIGCIRCGYNNNCFYEGKDEFIDFYKEKLTTADIIIFAGKIKDRYLSSRWKMFFDRAFFNTHIPSLKGKQLGFIISGPFRQIPNLNEIISAYVEWQGSNLCGIATDEYENSDDVDKAVYNLAFQSVRFSEKKYIRTPTFLGIGGMKVFRDDIWGRLRFPFVADHKYYRENGVYDFPQKDYRSRIENVILYMMIKIPLIRDEIYMKRMKDEMIKPLQKFVEDTK